MLKTDEFNAHPFDFFTVDLGMQTNISKFNVVFALFYRCKNVFLWYNVYIEFYSFNEVYLWLLVTKNYGSF